mmetsp:Transcript_2187/g.2860  ORF Transcript_2187/g.2860 Transcript_2187/m.2860 type:complete len:92 (+) Transcript_2187:35-310(+)
MSSKIIAIETPWKVVVWGKGVRAVARSVLTVSAGHGGPRPDQPNAEWSFGSRQQTLGVSEVSGSSKKEDGQPSQGSGEAKGSAETGAGKGW